MLSPRLLARSNSSVIVDPQWNRELIDPVTRSALRRLDWRFLLPSPGNVPFGRLLLVGGDLAIVDAVIASGLARSVCQEFDPAAKYDAAALLEGADVPLAELIKCLGLDAPVYVEVNRRLRPWRLVTPGRLRRGFLRVGLRPIAMFWARPSLKGCRMFLPLEAHGALAWYVAAHLTRRSPAHSLAAIGLAMLARLGSGWLGLVAPHLAITAVARPLHDAGEYAPPGPVSTLVGPAGHDVGALLLAGGEGDWSRVVLLPFAGAAVLPTVVIKVPRLATLNGWTEREQATLRRLRDSLGAERSGSLPDPLGTGSWRGLSVARESYVPGRSLASVDASWRRSRRNRERDLLSATEWLAQFHASVRPEEAQSGAPEPIGLGRLLAAYERQFPGSAGEHRLFGASLAETSVHGGIQVPIVWQHLDFGPWNVIRGQGQLHVLDWENARPGPALADLIYFTTHWLHTVRGHREGPPATEDVRELFLDPSTTARDVLAARSAIDDYLARLHLDGRWMGLMLVYTFAEQALERSTRLRILGQLPVDPRADNRYVRYVEELAARPQRLVSAKIGARPWSN
jgi:hypothetical protein